MNPLARQSPLPPGERARGSFPSRALHALRRLGIAWILLVFHGATMAIASETGSVFLAFAPAETNLADRFPAGPGMPDPAGQLIALGQFNDAAFSAGAIDEIGVLAPDGTAVPAFVDARNTGKEFGRIISVRLAFSLPAGTPAVPFPPYRLVWGPGLGVRTVEIDNWSVDPARGERYRTFTWSAGPANASANTQVASIEVIADSNAGYYSLWYLLPMALIFLLLTVRKLRAGE